MENLEKSAQNIKKLAVFLNHEIFTQELDIALEGQADVTHVPAVPYSPASPNNADSLLQKRLKDPIHGQSGSKVSNELAHLGSVAIVKSNSSRGDGGSKRKHSSDEYLPSDRESVAIKPGKR